LPIAIKVVRKSGNRSRRFTSRRFCLSTKSPLLTLRCCEKFGDVSTVSEVTTVWKSFVSLSCRFAVRLSSAGVLRFPEQIPQINNQLSSRSASFLLSRRTIRNDLARKLRNLWNAFRRRAFDSTTAVFPGVFAAIAGCARYDRNVRNLVDVIIFPIAWSSRNRRPNNYAINQPINRIYRAGAYRDVCRHYVSSRNRSRSSQLAR